VLRGGFEERSVFLVCEWKSTVCAPADLGLIYVDEDPWVSERATASVTGYGTVVRPANGLLVDELDRGVWARLILHNALLKSWPTHRNLPRVLAPRPNALVVRRLFNPQLLGCLWRLLQDLVEGTLGRCRHRIGLGNVRLRIALDRVVSGDLVAGRRGGGVADEGAGGSRCAARAQGAKGCWEHIWRPL